MIWVTHLPLEETRSAGRPCLFEASCEIDGVPYSATSRVGAVNELARVLKAAGIPDGSMTVATDSVKGVATVPSFYRLAKWAYEESSSVPLRRIPYARIEAARERFAQKGG